MKNKIIKHIGLVAIIVSIICFAGCAAQVAVSPGQPATTNSVTGVVTPAIPAIYTNIPNPIVTQVASYGTAALPFVPAPYNGILGGVLTLLTLAAGGIAAYKNKQLNTTNAKFNTTNAIVSTIVAGVEAAGEAATAVKQSIAKTAIQNGNADDVHEAVQNLTVPTASK